VQVAHTAWMSRSNLTAILGLAVLMLTACAGAAKEGVDVAPALVKSLAESIGHSSKNVHLKEDDLNVLAQEVGIAANDVRAAATRATGESEWQRTVTTSVTRISDLDEQTKDKVRSVMIDTACDVLNGKVATYDDFFNHLTENGVKSLTQATQQQLWDATQSLRACLRS
jgi:hypothetical protein